jgi:hypothetical protein
MTDSRTFEPEAWWLLAANSGLDGLGRDVSVEVHSYRPRGRRSGGRRSHSRSGIRRINSPALARNGDAA